MGAGRGTNSLFAHRSRPAALSAALLALACSAVPPLVERGAPPPHGEQSLPSGEPALPRSELPSPKGAQLSLPGEPAEANGKAAVPKVDPAPRGALPPAEATAPPVLLAPERSLTEDRPRPAERALERPAERPPRVDSPRPPTPTPIPTLPRPDAVPGLEPPATARDGAERLALAHGFVQIPNPIPQDTRFARLRLGMTKQDAEALLGLPDHSLHYANDGARIPFYASDDSSRWETSYRGQGRLLFSGAWLTGEVRLIRIEYDPREDGRPPP